MLHDSSLVGNDVSQLFKSLRLTHVAAPFQGRHGQIHGLYDRDAAGARPGNHFRATVSFTFLAMAAGSRPYFCCSLA